MTCRGGGRGGSGLLGRTGGGGRLDASTAGGVTKIQTKINIIILIRIYSII